MTRRPDEPRRDASEREDLQKAMARWGKLPVPMAPSEALEERRTRGSLTLRAAIGSAGRERQTRRTRIVSMAVAALALLLWGGFELFSPGGALDLRTASQRGTPQAAAPSEFDGHALVRSPGEVSRNHGGWVAVDAGHAVGEGDRVRARQRPVDLRLDGITSARVAPGSVLAIATLKAHLQELRLESGVTDFEVEPKRAARVVVHTDNARIHVTGTAFSVSSGGTSSEAWSEVRVQRGRVEIASAGETVVLRSGESWSSRENESSNASPAGAGTVRVGSAHAGGAHMGPSPQKERGATRNLAGAVRAGEGAESLTAHASTEEEGEPTTLSEENRMFRRALSARNAGNGGRCVGLLSEFLTKFPSSPLRQEAMVAHFRCSEQSGDGARAHRSASRYLSEYPSGFARDEARELVVGSAP